MSADEGEDRDKPIPVSERYRKSFITTLTWSALTALSAIGSIGKGNVSFELTKMEYPTPFLIIVLCLTSGYWFFQFRRSEGFLKLASSQFAFDHRSTTLAEALEGFRNEVISKTTTIAQMKAVSEPDFGSAKMLLNSSFQLLTDVHNHISQGHIFEHGDNLLYAVRTRNEKLEENSVTGLEESVKEYRNFFSEISNKTQSLIEEHSKNLLGWEPHAEHLLQAANSAYEAIATETQKILEVAATLRRDASEIDEKEIFFQRWFERRLARLMLGIALAASAYNIWHGFSVGYAPTETPASATAPITDNRAQVSPVLTEPTPSASELPQKNNTAVEK